MVLYFLKYTHFNFPWTAHGMRITCKEKAARTPTPRLSSRALDVPFTCFRLGLGLASRWPLSGPLGIPPSSNCTQPRSRSRYTATTSQSFTSYANQVLCAPSRPRYFRGPCASLTVILALVISALLRRHLPTANLSLRMPRTPTRLFHCTRMSVD